MQSQKWFLAACAPIAVTRGFDSNEQNKRVCVLFNANFLLFNVTECQLINRMPPRYHSRIPLYQLKPCGFHGLALAVL